MWVIAAGCLIAGTAPADIYEWTDDNGVKHFTNYAPPDHATILMKTEELPYDEAADRARMEADRQFLDELARLESAAREAELERRVAEAERRAAEAERSAQETLESAEKYLNDARNSRWYYRAGPYYPHYPTPYRYHHKGKSHNISHYKYGKKKYDKKYHRKKYVRPREHGSSISVRLRSGSTTGAVHLKARSRMNSGRGHLGGGSYGYRR